MLLTIDASLRRGLEPRWQRQCVGGGGLIVTDEGLRLLLPAVRGRYANVQIDDCVGRRREYPWHPPLRLRLRARLAPQLWGTAGFGFWNAPLSARGVVLPQALWFLHASQPSDIALATGVGGHGWKAACIDASGREALAWAPLAPLVLLLNRWPRFYKQLWPRVQHALRISEALLPPHASTWHTYEIAWYADGAAWWVDGELVLQTDRAPRGPLGFVAWVDTQWAAATPQGKLGWGLLDTTAPQWIEISDLQIR